MTVLIEKTLESLRELRLTGMAQSIEDQRINTELQALSFEERLSMAVDVEIQQRETRRLNRMITQAKFKHDASPENIDYRTKRGLDRQVIVNLLTCDYLEKRLNVTFTGPTGAGKTWLACALGQQAARRGYSVLYTRLSRLIEDIDIARGDGSLPKLRKNISKKSLLILDDWAMSPLTKGSRHELLEIIDDRLGNSSLMITSQLPIDKWHQWLGEATIADAILDRIVHQSHIIKLEGDSLRKKMSPLKSDKAVMEVNDE